MTLLQPTKNYNPHLGHKDEVIQQYQRMAWMIAGRYRGMAARYGIPMEDLVSEANVGLLKAFDRYNPDLFDGVTKFSTYAVPMMRGEVRRFIQGRGVHLKAPQRLYNLAVVILKSGLAERSAFEISSTLQCTPKEANDALKYIRDSNIVSTDQPLTDTESCTVLDCIRSETDFSQVEVSLFIELLSSREKQVLMLRLQGRMQAEISEEIGASQMTVNRILSTIGEKFMDFTDLRKAR